MIGFTGTQRGMTDAQRKWVKVFLLKQPMSLWVAHGDCIGADHDFHRIARMQHAQVHLFPPDILSKRAFCDYDRIQEPAPYLSRNHDIVGCSYQMIATPGEDHELLHSGTWATIRYTRNVTPKTLWVINPDGSVNAQWSAVSL